MNGNSKANPTEFGIWYSTWYTETLWKEWNIPFVPLSYDGEYRTHDTMDERTVYFHLEQMAKAEIDFILMDQTNNIDVGDGFINKRSLQTARTVKKFNDDGNRPVRYATAIGRFQFTADPADIELEARMIWERYSATDFGGPQYEYYLDGKPLLVVYAGNCDPGLWERYEGDKTYAERFTLRWANNDSTPGYYGWAYDKGSQWDDEVVVVMPGWNNMKGATPVPRNAGRWYEASWDVVLREKKAPRIILINSFNEYAERTAVWTCDSSRTEEADDSWLDADGKPADDMYWRMTVDNIRRWKEMHGQ